MSHKFTFKLYENFVVTLYVLSSINRPVTFISTGLIIGTLEYVLLICNFVKKFRAYLPNNHFKGLSEEPSLGETNGGFVRPEVERSHDPQSRCCSTAMHIGQTF